MSKRRMEGWIAWVGAVLAVLLIIWFIIALHSTRWFTQEGLTLTLAGVVVLVVFGSLLAAWYHRMKRKIKASRQEEIRRQREAERQSEEAVRKKEIFEAGQLARGLTKYRDRQGVELWGSREDIENWRRIDAEDRKLELAQEKEKAIGMLLDRVTRCRHGELEGLPQDQIRHMVTSWRIQISTLLNEGKSADTVIDVMCRNR